MNQSFFFLGFSSGKKEYGAFLVNPALAVALRDSLSSLIEQYQTQYGNIDVSGNVAGTLSPVQRS